MAGDQHAVAVSTNGDDAGKSTPATETAPAHGITTQTGSSLQSDGIALLTSFAGAAAAEAKKAAAGPRPDARVSAAFALGWQVADLYRIEQGTGEPPADDDDLPGLGRLSDSEYLELAGLQLKAGLAKVSDTIGRANLANPQLPKLDGAGADWRTAIRDFHVDLLQALTAADFRLGKAYGLGRSLADTCNGADTPEALITGRLREGRIQNICERLAELTTAFPPHAGHAVNLSLMAWKQWAAEKAPTDADAALGAIRQEGRRWRALLSAEKLATDTLTTDDYLTAGERALDATGSLTRRFLVRFWVPVIVVATLVGSGIAVMFAFGSAAAVVTGVGAILASLGLSWKGVGSSLGALAGRLEEPLWGSQLDHAIALHINKGPAAKYVAPPQPPRRRLNLLPVRAKAA